MFRFSCDKINDKRQPQKAKILSLQHYTKAFIKTENAVRTYKPVIYFHCWMSVSETLPFEMKMSSARGYVSKMVLWRYDCV